MSFLQLNSISTEFEQRESQFYHSEFPHSPYKILNVTKWSCQPVNVEDKFLRAYTNLSTDIWYKNLCLILEIQ